METIIAAIGLVVAILAFAINKPEIVMTRTKAWFLFLKEKTTRRRKSLCIILLVSATVVSLPIFNQYNKAITVIGPINENVMELEKYLVDNISIKTIDYGTPVLVAGDRVRIELSVLNDCDKSIPVWVGASFIDEQGNEYHQASNDIEHELPANRLVKIARSIVIPNYVKPGMYSLQTNLWYGKKSDPDRSIKITGVLGDLYFHVKSSN